MSTPPFLLGSDTMRLVLAFACIIIFVWLGVVPGHAEKRVALVIGNSTYGKVARLPNPANDANAMAAMFRKAGFDVVQTKANLDLVSMRRALRDFADVVRDADVAVVFYAGHGIEVNGTNYLIPIDAVLERDIDVEDEAVSLDRVSQIIEPAKRLRLIILDACRDNPFASRMKRSAANRSIGRGLARVDVLTADTLVAFAAKNGSTAADGSGPNSPYTSALLQHLVTPGLDVRLAMGRVRDQVLSSTGGKQEPFVYGSLGGAEVSLVPAANTAPAPSTPLSEAERAWLAVKDTTSVGVLEDFIRRYSDTIYGTLARDRLDALTATLTFEQGVDRAGNTILELNLPAADARLCQSMCVKEPRCTAWVYRAPEGRTDNRPHCWLRNNVTKSPLTNDRVTVSGDVPRRLNDTNLALTIEQGVDRAGNTILELDLSSPDPWICQSMCVKEARCTAWVYRTPEGRTNGRPHCWLRNNITKGPPTNDRATISGDVPR
jgi:uncharacterized caspase-like protein